jgi:hypothetical protein
MAESETQYGGRQMTEMDIELRKNGGKVNRNSLIYVPRTKPVKDMDEDERRAYKAAYQREYVRAKRSAISKTQPVNLKSDLILDIAVGEPEINPETGRARRNSVVKIEASKRWVDMNAEERAEYQRAYSREYHRVKREQAQEAAKEEARKAKARAYAKEYYARQKASAAKTESDPKPVVEAKVETVTAETPDDGFVVRYDEYGVAQWLPGETIDQRKRRRAEARLDREISKQKSRQKKAVGKLHTPGAPKLSPEEREKRRIRSQEYYEAHKERLKAKMSISEAKAAGWSPQFSDNALVYKAS